MAACRERAPMKVAIGLGTSLAMQRRQQGPMAARAARLELTVRQLAATPGLALLRTSPWVSTPPLRGGTARGVFLNGVALFESELAPHAVLDRCIALEERAGRRRARKWGDRTLDLDVLLVEGVVSEDARLLLPHPAIGVRRFVRPRAVHTIRVDGEAIDEGVVASVTSYFALWILVFLE